MSIKFWNMRRSLGVIVVLLTACAAYAQVAFVAPIMRISEAGVHERLGTVAIAKLEDAIEIHIALSNFPPGWHAAHIHENPSCEPGLVDGKQVAGAASGGHFDPHQVMQHSTIKSGGSMDMIKPHNLEVIARKSAPDNSPGRRARPLGDLPAVFTDEEGETDVKIMSYRLAFELIRGRSLVIHEYPDYVDNPNLPQGGGNKIACAVFPN